MTLTPSVPPASPRKTRLQTAVLVSLAALYSTGLVDHDLWTPDEPRVAAIAREVSEGSWIVPTLSGEPFLEEPPLHVWCVALAYGLLGRDPPGIGRVVSALFGIGTLVWTFLAGRHLARRFLDEERARRGGLLAALSLGLSVEHFAAAHRIVADGALAFFTTGATYALLVAIHGDGNRSSVPWLIAGYAMASLGFLSKTFMGLAAPALALVALAVVLRRPRIFKEARPWLAPLVFAPIVLPWAFLLWRALGAEGVREVFVENFPGRVLPGEEGSRGHLQPPTYYLLHVPVLLLPATIFAGAAAARRVRRGRDLSLEEKRAHDFSLLWFALGFLVLSAASTKRSVYMLPFFPGAAVAGGLWIESWLRDSRGGGWLDVLLLASLPAAGLTVPLARLLLDRPIPPWAEGVPLLALAAPCIAWKIRASRGREAFFGAWLVASTLLFVLSRLALVPAIDSLQTLGPVSREISLRVPRQGEIHSLRPDETTLAMMSFYAGRRIVAIEPSRDMRECVRELEGLLGQGKGVYLLTVDKERGRDPRTAPPDDRRVQYSRTEHLWRMLLFEDSGHGSRTFRLAYFPPQEAKSP